MLHLAHMQTLPSYGHTKQINSRIIQESKNRLNRNEKLTARPSMEAQQIFSSEDSFANINGYQMIDLN